MNQQTDEMRLYFARVRPLCGEIYATGLVITGDYPVSYTHLTLPTNAFV